jgi:cytochrome P450
MFKDPFKAVATLHDGPPIFWNPCQLHHDGRGAWFITKAETMREVLGNPTLFSSKYAAGFSKLIGENWFLNPLEIDPPDHEKYRGFLNPLFSPVAVKKLDQRINFWPGNSSCCTVIK